MGRTVEIYQLFNKSYEGYRLQLLALVILSFVGSIMEGVGINSMIPLFSFVNKEQIKGTDAISNFIENFFKFFYLQYSLRNLLFFIIVLFIIKAIVIFIATYLGARIYINYERNTRAMLFKH